MKIRIRQTCQEITLDVLQRVRVSFHNRINKCIEVNGRAFEHFRQHLRYTPTHAHTRTYARTHVRTHARTHARTRARANSQAGDGKGNHLIKAPRRHTNPTVRPPRGACWITLTPAVFRLFELNAFHPGLVFVLTLKIVLKVKMVTVLRYQGLLKYLKQF
ncbi:hypothetical protein ALC62_06843 [Cyphomyrmex costatus]|uniref:Uncharacterized protein n=1 Tax=Cyphomyrmex costatus TaxID=456900 RepID=A0A151IIC5_9HYME|nr:hypothetical protein ALC62_06843 [Cyphomyrmex costatus]